MTEEELSGYNEKHHILPRCLNGKNNKENLVLMPVRYHIMAHIILMEIYPEKSKLAYAVFLMASLEDPKGSSNTIRERFKSSSNHLSTRTISRLREEAANKVSNMARSEERRRKLSLSRLGSKNPNYGKHPSEETKKKLSESNLKRRDEISNIVKNLWESGRYDNSNIHKKGSENSHAKKIVGPDGTIYGCLLDAVETSGIPSTTLRQWMKGLTKNNHGWKYLNPLDAMTRKERKEYELNKNKKI